MKTETPDSASGLSAGTARRPLQAWYHSPAVVAAWQSSTLPVIPHCGRKVALELINAAAVGSSLAVERFLTEARFTARFNHPHIVTLYAVGEHEGQPYVALEYLEGQTLPSSNVEDQRLGAREIAHVASLPSATPLPEAHGAGILHRDLNRREWHCSGRWSTPCGFDFGLAKLVHEPTSVPPTVIVQEDAPPRRRIG